MVSESQVYIEAYEITASQGNPTFIQDVAKDSSMNLAAADISPRTYCR
jgi:hypothetical protein